MKSFLTFVVGISLGIAIGRSYNKKKYEDQMNDELREIRDYKKQQEKIREDINKKANDLVNSDEDIDNSTEEAYEEELEKAKTIINYSKYSKADEMDVCEKAASKNPIFVITPEEFASQVGYDTDTFYLFEDDVVANDNNDIVDNVKEMFGLTVEEIRNQFGIYEEDAVYVRDEKIQMDYEILRELDTYEKRNGE